MARKMCAALVLALAGFLPAAAAAAELPCLQSDRIYDWQALPGNRALIVTDSFRHRFKVTLISVCNDLQWHMQLGFAPFGGSQLECLSRGDAILARHSMGLPGERCVIGDVVPYTLQSQKADAMAARKPAP